MNDAGVTEGRRHWMSVLARAAAGDIQAHLEAAGPLPGHLRLRGPEVGLAMVRGRAGGTGAAFNLGEMTVTRCTVRDPAGRIGHAMVAGRDTVQAELAAALRAPVVTLEDLYGGWDGLEHGIDLLVAEVLQPLAAGRAARVPRYDWARGEWAEPWTLAPPGLLIVEGVGAGARRAARSPRAHFLLSLTVTFDNFSP